MSNVSYFSLLSMLHTAVTHIPLYEFLTQIKSTRDSRNFKGMIDAAPATTSSPSYFKTWKITSTEFQRIFALELLFKVQYNFWRENSNTHVELRIELNDTKVYRRLRYCQQNIPVLVTFSDFQKNLTTNQYKLQRNEVSNLVQHGEGRRKWP